MNFEQGKEMLHPITCGWLFATTVSALLALPVPAAADIVLSRNGNFDQGDDGFAEWTRWEQPGSAGAWFQWKADKSPITEIPMPVPPDGKFAAVDDSYGPASVALSQRIDVPASFSGRLTLSLSLYVASYTDRWYPQPGLDFNTLPNQQLRINLLKAGTNPLGASPADVLLPLYQTEADSPLILPWTRLTFDITSVLGAGIFDVVFALVNTQNFAVLAVTDVVAGQQALPEPSPLLLTGLGLVALAVVTARRGRRAQIATRAF